MKREMEGVGIAASEVVSAAMEKNAPVFWGQLSVIRLLKDVPFEVAGIKRGAFNYFVYRDQITGMEITSIQPASFDEVQRWEKAKKAQQD
jgi:hypothetical protein